MYAKLQFQANIPSSLRNRDIARLISESNAGTAALENLETIELATSTLDNTVPSGWALDDGESILAKGTTKDMADLRFVFKAPCRTAGKTKYAAISVKGRPNYANTRDAIHAGHMVGPVIDHGEANVHYPFESYSTSNTYNQYTSVGVRSTWIEIFATQDRIIFMGPSFDTNVGTIPRHQSIVFVGEFAENDMTLDRGLVPVVAGWYSTVSKGYYFQRLEHISSWDRFYTDAMIYFPQSIYDQAQTNAKVRYLQLMADDGSATLYHWDNYWATEDGTNNGIARTALSLYNRNYNTHTCSPRNPYFTTITKQDGSKDIPVLPMFCEVPELGTGLMEFEPLGMYLTPNSLGNTSDLVTIDGQDYVYFDAAAPMGYLQIRSGMLIKKV